MISEVSYFQEKKLQVIDLTKEDLGYPLVIKHGLLETTTIYFDDFPSYKL